MKGRRRHEKEEFKARLILTFTVAFILMLLGFFVWRLQFREKTPPRINSQPTNLAQKTSFKLVQTDCYEFYLPEDFEISINADCLTNAYARPRKHSYFNIAPYYDVDSEQAMIARWRARWLTLGAKEVSLDRVVWGGKTAWRAEEEYPQNGQRFVSYLLFLGEEAFRVDGKAALSAFELRAWATTDADKDLAVQAMQDWHWRF